MGWTGIPIDFQEKVNRKERCDSMFNYTMENGTTIKVLKSAMVGSTYYAAIEKVEDGNREVFGMVCLTHISIEDKHWRYFNYKEICETSGPRERKCPASILKLLTPTDSEWANEWRKDCWENANKKAEEIKKKRNLNFPVGTTIKFKSAIDTVRFSVGDEITLRKGERRNSWYGHGYRWTAKVIRGFLKDGELTIIEGTEQ